ncbi:MAG TPA: carboxylating nicotinate-nucleotide diphosphorylase, partial [Anaerolineae bacterium]|nr:carboxylating nicotinate-nucleotide diphosphorylase [Anaerolineae bacterium]
MTDQVELQSLLRAAEPLIDLAIAEDIGPGDATSESTLDPQVWLQGRIVAKAAGVVAGLPVAEAVFKKVDPAVEFTSHVTDGQEVVPGDLVATVSGPGPSLLAAERTALNFLQRFSGIASLTSRYVEAVALSAATILDTRKTIPGYRVLDKYAVRMGGGRNHRQSLHDMMLIKDNHIEAAGGITAAVTAARAMHPDLPVEVEVRDMDELQQALSISPPLDRIMLDNMSLAEMRQAVVTTAGRVELEASGNVTLERVAAIAATGVDYMSVGALTHSVRALDLSMEVGAPDRFEAPRDLPARVARLKSALAAQIMVLGHHYQRDEVLAFADA